jgi:hypothetical protein
MSSLYSTCAGPSLYAPSNSLQDLTQPTSKRLPASVLLGRFAISKDPEKCDHRISSLYTIPTHGVVSW